MTRGGRICFFNSLRSSRLAACLSRRRWTKTSSTTPVWSTARHHPCFTPAQAATNLVGEALAELARPLPHGFVADHDAARGQQLLHHAQPERKAEIQPHSMADDLGWKPMALVAGASGGRHSTRLSAP